jgi:hypothetical protein
MALPYSSSSEVSKGLFKKHWPFPDVDELLNLLRQGPVPWRHANIPLCIARMADDAPTTWVSLLVTTIYGEYVSSLERDIIHDADSNRLGLHRLCR